MLKYKTYVKTLSALLIAVFGGTFIYIYIYAKSYPIPLFHRISLDAKMMFIRDMPDKEAIDTIIVGSSIGLNNIQGIILEESSEKVKHVLNLSSFSLEVTHIEHILELISLFPNVKRVIYSAQSLDFGGSSDFGEYDFNFIKEYTNLGKKSIDMKYSFYAYKYFLLCVERQWEWQKEHMAHNRFSNIDFDRTGSAPLHIYGQDIIKSRLNNPWVVNTTEESYLALERIIKKTKGNDIEFYFVIQPYRALLVKNDKHLRDILTYFHTNSQKIVLNSGGKFLNLHNTMQLNDDYYFADRIHLNDKGSVLTAIEIAKYIDANE